MPERNDRDVDNAGKKKIMNTESEDNRLIWKPMKTEHIVQDQWIDFRRMTYQLPDQRIGAPFYNYSTKSYVVIVASDEEENFLSVRQFRHGIREVTTEFPAGGIEYPYPEEGERQQTVMPVPEQIALHAAKRELQEETGYISEQWSHLLTVPSNATRADNYAHIYRAQKCRKVSELSLDEQEFLAVRKYSACDIDRLIQEGKFQQAIHILAWLMVKEQDSSCL